MSDVAKSRALNDAIDVIAQAIEEESVFEDIYSGALRSLKEALGIERASIHFFDPDGGMRFRAWLGISDSYRHAVEGHTPWAPGTLDPEPIVVVDVTQDPSLTANLPIFENEDIRALAFIPLLYCRRVRGMFILYSRVPYDFNEEMGFALTLGKLIAFGVFRNQVESEIRESEELFRATFERSFIGKSLISSNDGRFLRVNAKFSEMTGYSLEELETKTFADITHSDDKEESQRLFKEVASGAPPYSIDKRFIRRDGTPVWVTASAAPIRDDRGQIVSIVVAAQDITDRKASDERNQKLVHKYQELVDSIDGIVWAVTPGFQFTFVSKQAERILGYSVEEWMSDPGFWVSHIHPDDREAAVAFCQSQCASLRDHDFDYRMIAADGRVVWLRDLVHVVVEDGRLAGLRGVMVDITDKKRTEEKLRESEERFRGIFEQAPFSIQLISAEGRTIAVNPAWKHLWGISQETIDNYIMTEYNVRRDQQLVDYLEKAFQGQPSSIPEILYEPASSRIEGASRWVEGYTYPVKNREGHLREVVLMHNDVTDRRHAEDQLRQSEARFRQIVETAEEGVWVIDRDAKTTLVNQKMAQILGYSQNEMMGRELFCFMDDESRTMAMINLDRRRQGIREQHEFRLLKKDGTGVWTLMATSPIHDVHGDYVGALAMVTDITDQKSYLESRERLLEQETHARKEAEKAVQLRDDFLSIATHELRTPLTPIRMNLQLIKHYVQNLSPKLPKVEFLQKAVQGTDREFERFLKLVENLLDVSRISAGRLALDRREFDLADLVKNVVERFGAEFMKAKCEVRFNSLGMPVGRWDWGRVEQVVVALLSNAMKYGAGRPIEVTVSRAEARALVQVTDHGIGISKEDQGRVFHRFERFAPIKHFGGLGLGLFIAQEIVEAHGGKIRLESEFGVGSTFTVELPLF